MVMIITDTCGTLFVDHVSGKLFNYPQISTTASETITSKHQLEALVADEGFHIKKYHSGNVIFASTDFKSDCNWLNQKYIFSGVGAHHQNGIAERNIKTVVKWVQANLLHCALHWPAKASIILWPFALSYAVWEFNRLPQMDMGLCPNEVLSQTCTAYKDFHCAHVLGCPIYVLEPKLQDSQIIPKWHPHTQLGMFLGFSSVHSSMVPLVLNTCTGRTSLQFHVIFDDKFKTVESLPLNNSPEDIWHNLLQLHHDFFLDKKFDPNGTMKLCHLPDLNKDWLPEELTKPVEGIPPHCCPHHTLYSGTTNELCPWPTPCTRGSYGSRGSRLSLQSSNNMKF